MMQTNYDKVKQLMMKYCFEKLQNNQDALKVLERLQKHEPQKIEDAKNLELLVSSLIYIYLKENGLSGRGGITAKDLAEYFGLKASSVTAKVMDLEFYVDGLKMKVKHHQEYEFIDIDRFKVNEMYWDFLESLDSEDITKSIKVLKKMIKTDLDFFDAYTTLYEYYLYDNEPKKALDILTKGYERAMNLVLDRGRFPDKLSWLFIENRHIIRVIFNYAAMMWTVENKKEALRLFKLLLKSNPDDNIGARYSIVALLEGYKSQEHFEEQFENDDGSGLDGMAMHRWFEKHAKKHKKEIGWWLEMV
jgi:tetratricopeptide (TPR) repeat protein